MDINQKKEDQEELHYLMDVIHSVGLPAEVLGEENGFPADTLVIAIPAEEEEGEEGTQDNHFVTVQFMPVTKEEAEYSRFLQFYTDVDIPEYEGKEEAFYRAASRMNQILPVGACFYLPKNEEMEIPAKFGIRHILTVNKEKHTEDTTFCETLFFLIYSYEYAEMAAERIAKGEKPEDVVVF